MKHTIRQWIALCTILVSAPPFAETAKAAPTLQSNYTHYRNQQLSIGAKTFPVLAQLTHRDAIKELRSGNTEKAHQLLNDALSLDPNFAEAYFTLARMEARQFSSDTFYYFSKGITTFIGNFRHQSLLAVNAVLYTLLMIILLASIFCIAFLIKYLPFAAHRLKELMSRRFNAALPGLSAYLILLVPFALLPGLISGFAILILVSWMFMRRREKLLIVFITMAFITLAASAPRLKQLAPLADPTSLTSRIAAANESAGDPRLIATTEKTPARGLETERDLAIGLLHLRSEHFLPAATYFLRAIERSPEAQMAYVNLGNVYYLQGDYEKALEGYRKAVSLNEMDPVCQYNLAQAYIKTLLLAESSKALRKASATGIEKVRASYAADARTHLLVYPKTFSSGDLWRISRIEGTSYERSDPTRVLLPLTRFPLKTSAWILASALIVAMFLSRSINRRKLTFQCSNCGELTCEGCCNDDRGVYLCQRCAETVDGVLSEKVIEALLRQRRQSVIVKRRKSIRMLTAALPGLRDIYYGRISRGVVLAVLFSFSLILLWAKGFLVKDWLSIDTHVPLWKIVVPSAAIAITYALSIFAKPSYEGLGYRSSGMRPYPKDHEPEESTAGAAVS